MSIYEFFTLAIATLSLCVSYKSSRTANRLRKQTVRLQEKQEELTELQLIIHREEARRKGQEGEDTLRADVRVDLERGGRTDRFVVRNWGPGDARNVYVDVRSPHSRPSPLISDDIEDKLPIPALAAGSKISLIAALTFDTGTTFDVAWEWQDPDGKQRRKESRLSL